MAKEITRFRCPACGNRHDADERVADGGRRLCPRCGHHVAEPIDAEAEMERPA